MEELRARLAQDREAEGEFFIRVFVVQSSEYWTRERTRQILLLLWSSGAVLVESLVVVVGLDACQWL